jgi:imidazolonepropionase
MDNPSIIHHAYLEIVDGLIHDFGSMANLPVQAAEQTIDADGQWMLPAFIDSHTHLLSAKDRVDEFEMRMRGKSYEAIAKAGGGILNSAKAMAQASESDLIKGLLAKLSVARKTGTAAIEIKSGYGLSVDSELKMLRVIQAVKEASIMPIAATFLGAHAVPEGYSREAYMDLVIDDMLPIIAKEGLADFVDIFCEDGYFTNEDLTRLASAASHWNLPLKSHVNQFTSTGGLQASLASNALSVDHLEVLTDQDLNDLTTHFQQGKTCMPVALPLCSLYLKIPYTPGRKIIDANLPLAIASDCNPGSAPSSNLCLAWGLACHQMQLTPMEGLTAITLNAAASLNWSHRMGSIAKGKEAHLILTKVMENPAEIPYQFGDVLIEETLIHGRS